MLIVWTHVQICEDIDSIKRELHIWDGNEESAVSRKLRTRGADGKAAETLSVKKKKTQMLNFGAPDNLVHPAILLRGFLRLPPSDRSPVVFTAELGPRPRQPPLSSRWQLARRDLS